jgi:tetratricopeptide (TPR) repeat protein
MRVPEQLVEVWAAGTDGRGKCGSGWVIGQRGVFSCRHVLERYLGDANNNSDDFKGGVGQARIQIRQASASSATAWVDCSIAWQHPAHDLVLLEITPRSGQSWDSRKKRLSRLAGTGQLPSECVAMGFPDAEAKPVGLRDSEQAPGKLLPAGAAREPDSLVPFDVDGSVPDNAALWEGFSGSAVVDQRIRLIGLVVKAHPARQQRRLLVTLVEDAADDPAFEAAAVAVGLDPTVEDYLAPLWRRSVEPRALAATGVPQVIADVKDLRVFGVHGSYAATRGSPIGYINRDKDPVLDAAITEARIGGRRIVLVTGDSAAGKSRTAAEALRRDPVLCNWRLVVPLSDGGLSYLANADLGWQDTILWLDDLDKYLARGLDLGTLRRILGDNPTVGVVATMRTSQLQTRQSQLMDPAWRFLTDDSEVTRINLEASLSDEELRAASAKISNRAMLSALQEGTGLGEWLVAGPELMKKLHNDRGLNRAFADIVIAWYRTGLNRPLAKEDARRLWADTLHPALRQRLSRRDSDEQSELFERASMWALDPVISRELYEQALILKEGDGYVAHDYVLDQTVRNPQRPTIADPIWEHALQVATSNPDPDQRLRRTWAVAAAAYREGALTHAMTAMQILADAGEVEAWLNIGVLLAALHRPEEAVGVYDQIVDRFGNATEPEIRNLVAKALNNKGFTLAIMLRLEEALEVFDQVVDRFGNATEPEIREVVAKVLNQKGYWLDVLDKLTSPKYVTPGAVGRLEEAVGVYDQVVDRFGDATEPKLRRQVAKALIDKGRTLDALGRWEEAVGVYDQVVDRFDDTTEPDMREHVANALRHKRSALSELSRPEEAIGVYDQVVDRFGDATEPELRTKVANALIHKGLTLDAQERRKEAIGVYDQVVDRFGDATEPELRDLVARALIKKGLALNTLTRVARVLDKEDATLSAQDREEEAVEVYDQVVDRFGDATEPELRTRVAWALIYKGVALGWLGRSEEAVGVYDQVVDRFGDATEPELRTKVANALINKGDALGMLGRSEEAIGVYDQMVDRFGIATEPRIRDLVADALRSRAEMKDQSSR